MELVSNPPLLPTVQLGRTGWDVARLGIGTYHLTRDRGVPRDEAVAVLRRAVLLGVSVVDTAPRYGLGQAEALVAEALHDLKGRYRLVDKLGRFERSIVERAGDDAYRDAELIRTQFEHSMTVLGRDVLDLLLIHEADWPQWWGLDAAPVLEVMRDLVREGRVERVGVSLRDPASARELCATGAFDVVLYVHYRNVVWQEHADAALAKAAANDMGVMVGAPYRQGLLCDGAARRAASLERERRADVPPGIIERIRRVDEIAREAGMSLLELGLRFLLSDPSTHVVLVGPRTVEELEENVRWAASGPLPSDLLAELRAVRNIEPGEWPLTAAAAVS